MRSQESRGSGRRRGGRRSSHRRDYADAPRTQAPPPAPKTLWQKIVAFFKPAAATSNGSKPAYVSRSTQSQVSERAARTVRKPEAVEVTSAKLYVGNLSFDATESDLHDLFKGVGSVTSAEIVSHKDSHRSKGFGFVTMTTIEEAKRAVAELHDKEFMGRKLVVSGAKTPA
jgi:RNA recognition motif-containing protein